LNDIDHIEAHFHELKPGDDRFFEWKNRVNEYQRANNPVFRRFDGFDYLPVQAFKDAAVCCFNPDDSEIVFKSSGTSGQSRSLHYVKHLEVYHRAILSGFQAHFGTDKFLFLGHLPAYEDQSSLVYMANLLIGRVGTEHSGLFLDDLSALHRAIRVSKQTNIPIILLGAAFGLLYLAEKGDLKLPENAIVIETGGMKTHRREMSRSDLHRAIADGFGINRSQIHSEYGMCEMMSQCYSGSDGIFSAPPWVEAKVLSAIDFRSEVPLGHEGVLALFDMANLHSQSAILTQDKAVLHTNGFEVVGRLDQAEIRGCNLLLEK